VNDSLAGLGEVAGVNVGVVSPVDAGVFVIVGVMVDAGDGGIAVEVRVGYVIVDVGDDWLSRGDRLQHTPDMRRMKIIIKMRRM